MPASDPRAPSDNASAMTVPARWRGSAPAAAMSPSSRCRRRTLTAKAAAATSAASTMASPPRTTIVGLA